MAFCQYCGQPIPDGSTMCDACAATKTAQPEEVAAQPEEAAAQPEEAAAQPEETVVAQPEEVAAVQSEEDVAQPEAPVAARLEPAAPYFQPAFTPSATKPAVQPPKQPMRIPLSVDQLPSEYKPLGAWSYFLYALLFSVPVIGLIFLIVFACGGTKNIHLRSYARSYFCGYLVLLIIATLICATVFILLLTVGQEALLEALERVKEFAFDAFVSFKELLPF